MRSPPLKRRRLFRPWASIVSASSLEMAIPARAADFAAANNQLCYHTAIEVFRAVSHLRYRSAFSAGRCIAQGHAAEDFHDEERAGVRRGKRRYSPHLHRSCRLLLLDSYRSTDKQIGALGVPHAWQISRRIVDLANIPVILAGGLGSDNVAEAIRIVRTAGVDSKTRTDRDGSHAKDLERVRRFHETARAAALLL